MNDASPRETGDAATTTARSNQDVLVRGVALAKAFGPTRALRAGSVELRAGEVHAVVGENGSGKSTLVKILSGVHLPDDGHVEFGGRVMKGFPSPRRALDAGIATVFQEVLVVEGQSVLDNVWMGNEGLFELRREDGLKRARARDVLAALLDVVPPLDVPAGTLPLSARQACGIARALLRDPRVLILDEATSALDVATRDRVFALLRELSSQGRGVIFISHRMDEIEELGDRITVLRSGDTVATLRRGQASSDELVRLMVGADHLTEGAAAQDRGAARVRGEVVLRTRGLRLRPGSRPIDVAIHDGELLGLAGLEGHGQELFLRALWGERVADGTVVRLGGAAEVVIDSPARAARHGVAYVPRDRRRESLFPTLSTRENFAVATLTDDASHRILRPRHAEHRFAGYVGRLAIRLGRADAPVTTLSGGNQQKVVVARWLASRPRVLLLNDPTRGVDLAAKRDLYGLLSELAGAGVAVVMLSTEIDEHTELMDRVLVFREGEVFSELSRAELSRETLVARFFGRGVALHV